MDPPFLPRLACLGRPRHAVLGPGEPRVAPAAPAAPRHDGLGPFAHEVGEQPLIVEDDGAVRDAHHEILPVPAVATCAGAGLAGLRAEVWMIREPREVVQVACRPEHDVAAAAAVATLRPPLRLVGLAPHGRGAVTAAAGANLHVDLVHERHAEQPRWSTPVVDWAARREDWHVVEPVTVWMVHLGLGDGRKAAEVRGTLTLGDEGLEFVERKSGADVRFDYTSIQPREAGPRLAGAPGRLAQR